MAVAIATPTFFLRQRREREIERTYMAAAVIFGP